MKTYIAKTGEVEQKWYLVDAKGQTLGRLAAKIARILQGKHKPQYTPHTDTGDYVVVVNADKFRVTGRKMETVRYYRHSGYHGGQKSLTMAEMLQKKPERVLWLAVRRMMPKGYLGMHMVAKLKVHCELPKHAYRAQQLQPLDL
jgi:large subunit ribosomal protein L13